MSSSLKQKKLIFNVFVNRNLKKLTDSRKNAKILADNRKSHHPMETLSPSSVIYPCLRSYRLNIMFMSFVRPNQNYKNYSLSKQQFS